MSDLSDELTRPVTEDEQVETSVISHTGMHFPWIQKQLATVGKQSIRTILKQKGGESMNKE
jgi:hypothetical protein